MDRNRFLGGNPVAVVVRLVILSIVVGIVLSALNIRPDQLLDLTRRLIQRISDLGFGVFETAFGYFLLGAVIVIPIWLIARLFGVMRKGDDGRS